jgi:hypothetical protein
MKTIYKYPLEDRDPNQFGGFTVNIPNEAKVLSATVQNSKIVLYISVETDDLHTAEPRIIFIAGTGHMLPGEVEDVYNFIGTVEQASFVWHVYAEPGVPA